MSSSTGALMVAFALLCARPALGCEPVLPEVRSALDAQDFESAERLAKAALAKNPDSSPPRISLAQVYIEWSQLPDAKGAPSLALDPARSSQAVKQLDEAVARWPTQMRPHICLIELHQLRGETEPFLESLARALRTFPAPNPELAGSLEFTVRRFLESDKDDLAEKTCTVLLARPDVTIPVLSNCGLARMRLHDPEGALARFRTARARDPKDGLVAYNLAMAAVLTNDLAAAERTLGELVALEPERIDGLFALAVVTTARDPSRAAPAWRRVVARDAADPTSESEAARGFAQSTLDALARPGGLGGSSSVAMAGALVKSDPALAVALLQGSALRAPDDPSLPYLLGQAFEANGLDRHAYQALERAAALPTPTKAAGSIAPGAIDFEAGRIATKIGRYADALAHLERARRASPDLPNLEYLLGHAHEGLGNPAAARREYAACLERPNNASYADWCRKNLARLAEEPAAPAAATQTFDGALRKARANEATPAGNAYSASSTAALGSRLSAAVRACIPALPAGTSQLRRTLLARVGAEGSIAETLHSEDGPEADCFAARLRGATVGTPPSSDWWLVYDLTIRP